MVGPMYDYLANPLGAVRLTFEKAVASGSDPSAFDGKDWGAVDLFRHFLAEQDAISQVPVLNPFNLKWIEPNTLVRYRGMIQDMLGNEFYVGAYKSGSSWKTNKFTDLSPFLVESSPDMRIWERRLLYCVLPPGQNSWIEPCSASLASGGMDQSSENREKRQRMDSEDGDHMDLVTDDEFNCHTARKKMREDGQSYPLDSRDCTSDYTSTSLNIIHSVVKDPLPCLVKIYDSPESELKLNEVFEFVGILTFDSESELAVDKDDHGGFSDETMVQMPPSKVPRLHCIIYRKLATHDFLPSSPVTEQKPHLLKETRESLLRHLASILGNDGIAAQFMLFHLLSKVHTRTDDVAVGKLSMNLTGFSKETVSVFGSRLSEVVKKLLPFTQWIPLTLEYLNATSLAPKKDYQINRLMPGVLQMPEGSHLIIDETQLQAGMLNSVGVGNTRLLKDLTEFQKVEYDFQYYKMDMAADVNLLVLSEAKSNIVPADVVVLFQPSSVCFFEEASEEAIKLWRWYLASVRSLPHSIGSEMQKVVEDDMVAARQADRSLSSRDFSRWLTMGRLISSSFGETCLSLEHWQMVKELERLRGDRLK